MNLLIITEENTKSNKMKQIKTIILLCLLVFMAAKVQAQYTLTNTYDESGNRG